MKINFKIMYRFCRRVDFYVITIIVLLLFLFLEYTVLLTCSSRLRRNIFAINSHAEAAFVKCQQKNCYGDYRDKLFMTLDNMQEHRDVYGHAPSMYREAWIRSESEHRHE